MPNATDLAHYKDDILDRLARDVGLAIVNQLPPLKRLLMRDAMGMIGDRPRLARGEPL